MRFSAPAAAEYSPAANSSGRQTIAYHGSPAAAIPISVTGPLFWQMDAATAGDSASAQRSGRPGAVPPDLLGAVPLGKRRRCGHHPDRRRAGGTPPHRWLTTSCHPLRRETPTPSAPPHPGRPPMRRASSATGPGSSAQRRPCGPRRGPGPYVGGQFESTGVGPVRREIWASRSTGRSGAKASSTCRALAVTEQLPVEALRCMRASSPDALRSTVDSGTSPRS